MKSKNFSRRLKHGEFMYTEQTRLKFEMIILYNQK